MAAELQCIINGVNAIVKSYEGHGNIYITLLGIHAKFPELSMDRIVYHFATKSKQQKESSPCYFCMCHTSVDTELAKIIRQKPFYLSKQISEISEVPEEIVLDHMSFHMK